MLKRVTILFVLVLTAFVGVAQEKTKLGRWSVQAGIGLTHYINTLKVGADFADVNHVGYSFRFMREWEHRLAFGVETGYYTFYEVAKTATPSSPQTGDASLSVVPILINFRMRIVKDFYLTGGTGFGILTSKADALGSVAENSQLSLADFQLSALYLKPINDHVRMGCEFKFLNSAKTEDYSLGFQVVGAYRF